MPVETTPFDAVDFLRDDEDTAGYLAEMLDADSLVLTERADAADVEAAMKMIEGTARSMGITVVD